MGNHYIMRHIDGVYMQRYNSARPQVAEDLRPPYADGVSRTAEEKSSPLDRPPAHREGTRRPALARLSGFDPIDNFFRVVSSEFPKRREPEMGLNGL